MRDRDDFGLPEQRASTGLPLSIMLLSVLTIAVYLTVAGAFLDDASREVAAYTPQPAHGILTADE
ncbi:hypothetical protein [Sinorhizobium meliloti]|uniref:hypothetical protein n=1 Tax=Rhizobium meliloti TaxID=382 RepID=UPI000FE09305|nr:hypothetical protein [Sinorhizobium meliloti]MDX0470278.1 hypothetical protein [Sinorhizobium medicae]MDX0716524.1 hypothetical protein [Sinorhizobium medicae]MDX0846190.1 hypothetical protein [Sinorhizobium medicae]MDX1177372.1 hypothetical protein [Sinorhizobium medicae]MDX1250255.1 hypothetical protein [Sinorhizobium medicae]